MRTVFNYLLALAITICTVSMYIAFVRNIYRDVTMSRFVRVGFISGATSLLIVYFMGLMDIL